MTRWAPVLYRRDGEGRGIPSDVIAEALSRAHLLQDKGLPPILTLGHLAFQTGISYSNLRSYVSRKHDKSVNHRSPGTFKTYRTFRIKKRSGGYRRICIPNNHLLKVQRWIDQFILDKVKASPFSYAFEKHQTILDCAKQHLGCRWLIKIDLRNFFESLSEIQVYRVFLQLGYQPLVSFELARICTKDGVSGRKYHSRWWKNEITSGIPAYKASLVGHLPQGAPTSPKLANLIVRALDLEIADIANKFGLVFTRYADDLTFSTECKDFSRGKGQEFIRRVFDILPRHGLNPNPQKVHIVPPGARKIVLGLLVDGENKVRLSKDFRSTLECHWFYCSKDPVQHANRRGFDSVFGLKNYFNGLLSYAKQIDSEYINNIAIEYGDINWPI